MRPVEKLWPPTANCCQSVASWASRRGVAEGRGSAGGVEDCRLGANPRQMRGNFRPGQVEPEDRKRADLPKRRHRESKLRSGVNSTRRPPVPEEQWNEQQESEQQLHGEAGKHRRSNRQPSDRRG